LVVDLQLVAKPIRLNTKEEGKNGKNIASGTMNETMTSENISKCFDLNAAVNKTAGRWNIHISEKKK